MSAIANVLKKLTKQLVLDKSKDNQVNRGTLTFSPRDRNKF